MKRLTSEGVIIFFKLISLPAKFLGYLLILLLVLTTWAFALADTAAPLSLTSSGSDPAYASTGEYDFDQFSPLQINTEAGLIIRHTFTLHNLNNVPIRLDHFQFHPQIRASLLNKSLPYVVNPGDEVAVEVELDTTQLEAGKVQKSVEVFLQGQSQPVATLQMIGTYVSPVAFLPTIADFGTVFAGTPKTIMVQMKTRSSKLRCI